MTTIFFPFAFAFAALIVWSWGSWEYFSDIPRIGILLGVLLAPFLQLAPHGSARRGVEEGESRLLFFLLALLSTAVPAFVFPFFAARGITAIPVPPVFRYAGLLLYASGFAIRAIALRTLKKQFSIYVTVQQNHQLITSGIYSKVRHPIYLGIIVLLAGMFLVFPTIYGFLFVVIYSILLTHRMKQEETLLLKHFGSVYQEYSAKSYRLIPHIY